MRVQEFDDPGYDLFGADESNFGDMARVDTELGGVPIPAGSLVDVMAGAANRDPNVFGDPDKFDIFRERKPHFSFARGPHICLGQHLARVEMTRALTPSWRICRTCGSTRTSRGRRSGAP